MNSPKVRCELPALPTDGKNLDPRGRGPRPPSLAACRGVPTDHGSAPFAFDVPRETWGAMKRQTVFHAKRAPFSRRPFIRPPPA